MDIVKVQSGKRCYLCGCTSHRCRPGKVRDDESLKINECQECGLVFLSRAALPDEFYEKSCMHSGEPNPVADWLHDTDRDDERRFRSLSEAMTNRHVLDFGCGVGGFLMKAGSRARQVTGIELEARLTPHFQASGLEVFQSIDALPSDRNFDLITAFHVVEHLEDPAIMLRKLATRLRGGGRIIMEVPSSDDALLTLYKNGPFSEFTYWSCHLYLFNAANIPLLAKKAGLRLEYVSYIQRYPLSNHLYWLAEGKPGGHQLWGFLDSEDLSRAYEARLASLGRTDTLIASLSL
jgi:SAM-dependent methyltransferase